MPRFDNALAWSSDLTAAWMYSFLIEGPLLVRKSATREPPLEGSQPLSKTTSGSSGHCTCSLQHR